MKKIIFIGFLLLSIFLVSGASNLNMCKQDGGVQICDTLYCCGDDEDGICPEAYGSDQCMVPDADCPGCLPNCQSRQTGKCSDSCKDLSNCNLQTYHYLDSSYICDGINPNTIISYNATHDIICCDGVILPKINSLLSGPEETIVKYTKLVKYRKEPVRMVMVIWG